MMLLAFLYLQSFRDFLAAQRHSPLESGCACRLPISSSTLLSGWGFGSLAVLVLPGGVVMLGTCRAS